MSAEPLEELDLEKFITSQEGRRRLIPFMCACACRLYDCGLTESLCEVVASALTSDPSYLTDLDLNSAAVVCPPPASPLWCLR
uniref:Uncharacterized protein n=1 Tax=Gouania willdenowi TaxID=441366 RepID=A0A8C5HIT5_GOUWI